MNDLDENNDQLNTPQDDDTHHCENYDFDIELLKENLKRTPAERIKRHQIALNSMKKFKKAKFL